MANKIEENWKKKYNLLLKDWQELGKKYWQLEVKFKHFLENKEYDKSLKILNKKVNDLKENQNIIIDAINVLGTREDA